MEDIDDMDTLIVAYADGELDAATGAKVEAYIAATPAAQRMFAIHRETASLLRAAFPESLYAKESAIRALPAAQVRRRLQLPRYGWAIAASLLMGLFGYGAGATWMGMAETGHERILTEVAEYHAIYSRETVHLVEVPAAETEHLKTWLGKRVNRSLVIPDFKESGLTFAGGRMVVLNGAPVAELMYTRANGLPIAFCVLYHQGKPSPVVVERRGKVNLATWDDGSNTFFVVGEADAALMRDLAAAAKKQL